MNREDMIRMAREAGWQYADGDSGYEPLWAFAALVAEHERERILAMCKEGLWDGDGIRFHLKQKEAKLKEKNT